MRDEYNNNTYQPQEKAGCFGIIISILFPIVGIILYFVKKDSVSNPKAYLYAALLAIAVGMIIGALC